MAKMFFCLVKPSLYWKVFKNTLLRKFDVHTPSSAILGMTYRCQCKCVHCSAGSYVNHEQNELSTKEWFQILDDIKKMGVPRINISGGEALLRSDIFEIIEYASKYFVVILESNGLLVSEEVASKLKKAKVSCVAMSVDSVSSTEHDSLRKVSGCFGKVVEGINNLKKFRIPCIMSTYITSDKANKDYIEDLMLLARKNDVMAMRILPPRPVGSFSCNISSLLKKKDEDLIKDQSDPFISYFNGMPAPSLCGIFSKATFYLSPYGDIQPCPFMPIAFGNIKKKTLSELLSDMWSHQIFNNEGKECLVLSDGFREKYLNDNDSYPVEVEPLIN